MLYTLTVSRYSDNCMFFLLVFLPLILFTIIVLLNKTLEISLFWSLPISFMTSWFLYSVYDHAIGTRGPAGALSSGVILLLACQIAIICSVSLVVYLRKRGSFFQWTLLVLVLGIALGITYDRIFIEPHEIGEKGNAYYYNQYPAWRILD